MNILVTGGGGFLGRKIIDFLLAEGHVVSSFSRKKYPSLLNLGVENIIGDLQDPRAVDKAIKGTDVVFHVAARVGLHGPYQEFYQTNVIGTQNIVNSCLSQGVEKLIYTSSPSVIFDGNDHQGTNENTPYPKRYLSNYQATKAAAEQFALGANGENLAVVSLRPHLIWGPNDPHFLPKITESAKKGKLMILGDGQNLVDTVYIDNAALSQIIAMKKLEIGSEVAGKVFFITNQEPWPMKKLINAILKAAGQQPIEKHIPIPLAYAIGFLLEKIYQTLPLKGEPRLSRLIVKQLSKSHWYDPTNARKILGYKPEISLDEGFERLKSSLI